VIKNVGAAIVRFDETEMPVWIEELNRAYRTTDRLLGRFLPLGVKYRLCLI
jgi:hypothetical protein